MPLDPAYAAATATIEDYEADWTHGAPEALRRVYDEARGMLAGDEHPDCRGVALAADGAAGLAFTPPGAARDAIVYFHGGSWMVGSPETHRALCSQLAAMTGLPVYSMRYRLAPEHKWPSQRDDGVAAVQAVLSGGLPGHAAPERVVIAGDSAGAAISFWIDSALEAGWRDRVSGVFGFYGAYGLTDSASMRAFGRAGDGVSHQDVMAAYARLGDLDALLAEPGFTIAATPRLDGAPCYLAAAALDPLLDDSRALHEGLDQGGRDSTLDVAEGLPHSYAHYVGRVPAARAAMERAAAWVRGLG